MTIKIEIERAVVDKGTTTKSREALLELEERKGVHKTEFGDVQIDVIRGPTYSGPNMGNYYLAHYYRTPPYNTDIIIDVREAPDLAASLRASKRRISVGRDGKGAQQIGKEVTLFVHSDSFRREKR